MPQEATPRQEAEMNASNENQAEGWRYLALGDSYTIGQGIPEQGRWPNQLVDTLRMIMPEIAFEDAEILATTGWTTAELMQAFDSSELHRSDWDMVSLLIGVNDQFDGISLEQYRIDLEAMLERAIAATGQRSDRVFVVSIPNYAHTPYGWNQQQAISDALIPFNESCREISQMLGAHYLNITPLSEEWPEKQDWTASDGLHPSAKQYQAWVRAMVPKWQEALTR